MTRRRRAVVRLGRLGAALTLAAMAPLAGCVSAEPRTVEEAPRGTEAKTLMLALQGKVLDSDGDVYPDTMIAQVYVMGNWPVPLSPEGAEATFTLYDRDDAVLGEWKFDRARTRARRRELLLGTGYVFPLRITDFIDDAMPPTPLSLDATFLLDDGAVVKSRGRSEKLFGREGG